MSLLDILHIFFSLCFHNLCFSSTVGDSFSPQCQSGQRSLSNNRAMVYSPATLGLCFIFLVDTFAIPPYRTIGNSAPRLMERSMSSLADDTNSITLPDLHLNTSISIPTPSHTPVGYWAIECNQEIIPPGWFVPPETTQIEDPTDCRSAIFRVTRGGNPRESQVWTSKEDWSYRSCGVSLAPGWLYSRIRFARIDVAEVAQEIARKCVTQEHDFMGGWAAIGEYFIVLLTGRETSGLQPSSVNLRSSQS